MLRNEAIKPQLDANDFGFIVNLLKPVLHDFASINQMNLATLEKLQRERSIFERFIQRLEENYKNDVLLSFLSDHWQKFMNDLEVDKMVEQLEGDTKTALTPQQKNVQTFFSNLMLLFGITDQRELPLSGVELVKKLHDRRSELAALEMREQLKIKWLDLFKSKDLSTIGFDELVNMIENLDLILSQHDQAFTKTAHAFFGKEVNLTHLTSKDVINQLKKETNLKAVPTPKHQIILRELLEWNKFFTQIQKNKIPDEEKLAAMIKRWPELIEDLFSMSMESPSTFSKTSSRFFKSMKKIFGIRKVPLTVTQLVNVLHQRIMLVEPEALRTQLDLTLQRAAKH